MHRLFSSSDRSVQAFKLVQSLQQHFVQSLEAWSGVEFSSTEWFRDEGQHGGGVRHGIGAGRLLGRASVNGSQVQYEDDPSRPLRSASALSAIVHPAHPHAPSAHIHISWTEMKAGPGYWRIMADLNPALVNDRHTDRFADALRQAAPTEFAAAVEQGDRYFFIPALQRHRGVVHFYLEQYASNDFTADLDLARRVGKSAVDGYMALLHEGLPPATENDRALQLAYHTLYFFQVLTLDRGTTAGLLVHDQNDIGILGSLPPRINRELLASWAAKMTSPQDQLLSGILAVLPEEDICCIEDDIKQRLADALRSHYRRHPEALKLQASGLVVPPTIDNHEREGSHGT